MEAEAGPEGGAPGSAQLGGPEEGGAGGEVEGGTGGSQDGCDQESGAAGVPAGAGARGADAVADAGPEGVEQ